MKHFAAESTQDNVDFQDCPGCSERMRAGQYLCATCIGRIDNYTPSLTREAPQYKPRHGGCKTCPETVRLRCADRVVQDINVLCEIPDVLDLGVRTKQIMRL